ncbi:MAG TPA: DUF1775 domain-containing protein [Steroidobacteraceae bacterium]
MLMQRAARLWPIGVFAMLCSTLTVANVRIFPVESQSGVHEKYTLRVPNEKMFDTVRIVGEFPAGLKILNFEFKPGWKLNIRKDAAGNIIGAEWRGRLRPYEFAEFGLLGVNPAEPSTLVWKFVQHYADGSKAEYTGPAGARFPAPVTRILAVAGATGDAAPRGSNANPAVLLDPAAHN